MVVLLQKEIKKMKTIAFAELTDEQLVLVYQEKQEAVYFGELYKRYYEKLFQYCQAITHDRDEAYDLTQESFLKAAENIAGLRNPALFPSWLFRIAHNSCIDSGKIKQRMRIVPVEERYDLMEEEFDQEGAEIKEGIYERMDDLLKEVACDAKDMLISKYCGNVSIRELQDQYGLSESAVKMRLARARKRMLHLINVEYLSAAG